MIHLCSLFFPEELVMWLLGKTEFSCLIGDWFHDEKSNETRAPWWVDPSDISLQGSNFPVGRDFRRSWVASPTDHREAQRITFSQICPQKSSSRFLFVYFCFVLFFVLDPVVWAPWWHNLWDLRFSSLMNIKSMIPEGHRWDRSPFLTLLYLEPSFNWSGCGWWNALGSEQWNSTALPWLESVVLLSWGPIILYLLSGRDKYELLLGEEHVVTIMLNCKLL